MENQVRACLRGRSKGCHGESGVLLQHILYRNSIRFHTPYTSETGESTGYSQHRISLLQSGAVTTHTHSNTQWVVTIHTSTQRAAFHQEYYNSRALHPHIITYSTFNHNGYLNAAHELMFLFFIFIIFRLKMKIGMVISLLLLLVKWRKHLLISCLR